MKKGENKLEPNEMTKDKSLHTHTHTSTGFVKTDIEIIIEIITSLQHRFTELELLVHKLEQQIKNSVHL